MFAAYPSTSSGNITPVSTGDPNVQALNWLVSNPVVTYYPAVRVDYTPNDKMRFNVAWNMTKFTTPWNHIPDFPGSALFGERRSSRVGRIRQADRDRASSHTMGPRLLRPDSRFSIEGGRGPHRTAWRQGAQGNPFQAARPHKLPAHRPKSEWTAGKSSGRSQRHRVHHYWERKKIRSHRSNHLRSRQRRYGKRQKAPNSSIGVRIRTPVEGRRSHASGHSSHGLEQLESLCLQSHRR